jgi:hypothetical protein
MKNSGLMVVLTVIIISVALFGRYVNTKINESATLVSDDILASVPLLSYRFDYYGTVLDNSFSEGYYSIKTLTETKEKIVNSREITQKYWDDYKNTKLTKSEDSTVKIVDQQMESLDKEIDVILDVLTIDSAAADSLIKIGNIHSRALDIADKVGYLLDLQYYIGKAELSDMLKLVKTFDQFIMIALGLSVVLLGSILFLAFVPKKESESIKKPAVVKKPVVKKPVVKKPVVKDPVEKNIVSKK